MKKHIFRFMSLNILLTALLITVLSAAAASFRFGSQIKTGLKSERVTLISDNGEVTFDNYANPELLDNHLNRPEVAAAMSSGYGESERFSDTLMEKTYYYAMKLTDGNILRLAVTTASIYSMMIKYLPILVISLILVLIISFFMARVFTNRVLAPINRISLNDDEIDTYDELSPFIREIERQKQKINEQLVSLENRANTINAITGNMKEGLILTDKDGIILSANISAKQILHENDMTDKNIIEICRYIDLLQKMKQCLFGENTEMVFEKDGKTYNIYFSPVLDDGKVSGAVVLFLDITEKRKAEKQRREFSANVSHELKTPLTTISALSEMIENRMVKDEDVGDFISKISAQTGRLISIVDDIIKLSEFDEGNIVREFTRFDLLKLVESSAAALNDKASSKNVSLSVTGKKIILNANECMFDELLYNLIDNGIKYNKDGGKVEINICKDGDYCKITVTDTGIGIPAEQLDRVFERFYRVDNSRSKKTGGTGLGLSIVKHIAEHHNGKVEIKSEVNFGTVVECLIPINNG